MTTPRTRRAPRAARPSPRANRIPSAEFRRARGPRPPDSVIVTLQRALEADLRAAAGHQDADETSATTSRFERLQRALVLAGLAITRAARRGVVNALQGPARAAALAAPPPEPTDEWDDLLVTVAAAVAAHQGRGATIAAVLLAVGAVIAALVLREHARRVEAIARAAGSRGYVWTTRKDANVRELHRELEGTIQRWASPPVSGTNGFRGHPGEPAGPCRCQAFPLL